MSDTTTELLDLLQTAPDGSDELDSRIDCILTGRGFSGMAADRQYHWYATRIETERQIATPDAAWSRDLVALIRLVSGDHDFSLGARDGVLWAWVQPSDGWTAAADESRHDHPRGSGLIVANTLPLAMAAAVVAVHSVVGQWPRWRGSSARFDAARPEGA